ncbi:MAG TPA: glucosylceramidase, partial [Sphingobacteriaceae bacterium]
MTKFFPISARLSTVIAVAALIGCRIPAENRTGSSRAANAATAASGVSFWLTSADSSVLLKKQDFRALAASPAGEGLTIDVEPAKGYQTIDGFGFTLTGGSATLINSLKEPAKTALLNELFSSEGQGIGLSYLRISIGASDLSQEPFTYNDLPGGGTDVGLQHFSLEREKADLIPVLKRIIAINPDIKILGSPWSAPTWMKTNNSFIGGSLKP